MKKIQLSILFCILVAMLISCGEKKQENKSVANDTVSTKPVADTVRKTDTNSVASTSTAKVNGFLEKKYPGKWHVVTDKESGWLQDAIDYFVTPERKKDPDFPYIAKGDFNCDGKPDIAALVTGSNPKEAKLVIISDDGQSFEWWKEDVQGAAIKTYNEKTVSGFETLDKDKKVSLNCQGIDLAWFEKSSYVVYWNGKKYENVWTGD